jgi:hypothetical protein
VKVDISVTLYESTECSRSKHLSGSFAGSRFSTSCIYENAMDERVEGQLGLVVLYEAPSSSIECVIYSRYDPD